jgi:hypothetical protein
VALPPALVAAISHSLATPGALLSAALAAKAARAVASGSAVAALPYLRVGVAPRAGALAPGEPFVLEIWPAGSRSPIHGHGGCCGGFVVLHGALTLRTFNSLDGRPCADAARPPLFEGVCGPGALGWFDPTHHQVHSIAAAVPPGPGSFCATLQAFRYADCDDVASPFMEVECEVGRRVADVDPESDFEYAAMAPALLAEYAAVGKACTGSGGGDGSVAQVAAMAAAAPGGEDEDEGEAARFVWVI